MIGRHIFITYAIFWRKLMDNFLLNILNWTILTIKQDVFVVLLLAIYQWQQIEIEVALVSYSVPKNKNVLCAFQIICSLLFFTLWDFWRNYQTIDVLQNLNAVSTISNISSYNIFSIGVDWPIIQHLMEVSNMFVTCTYCVYT